jgi:hypothetical protein
MKRILLSVLLAATAPLFAQDAKPLKVLLITGGCCHDYAKQKDILQKGLEERLNGQGNEAAVADLGKPGLREGLRRGDPRRMRG